MPGAFKRCRVAGLASASVISLALVSPAFAQAMSSTAAAADSAPGISDIIVTAQFREQRLQDTPIAITAISGADLEKKALNNIADIGKAAPNVNIAAGSSAYGAGATIFIRGIGQYDTNFALEPGVGVYVDDVYHGVLVGSIFDLLDLDRVEILRGPQGTLAGKNSIGGAVKLYSRKPEGSGDGYIQATLGSYSRIDLRGAYDLKLTDTLAMRFSAFSKRRSGFVKRLDFACDQPELAGDLPSYATGKSCQIGTMGGIKSWGARADLRWRPTDTLEINLIASIVRDDSDAGGVELTYADNPTATRNGVPFDSRFIPNRHYVNYATFDDPSTGWHIAPKATTHSQSVSGHVNWQISDKLTLTSITAYEDLESLWTLDNDLSPIGVALTLDNQPYHQFTQELRLNGEIGDKFVEWTLGGFYFHSLGRVRARVKSGAALNFIQDDPVKNRSEAVYAQAIVHPVPEMSLTAGIRYTDDKKSYTFYRADPNGGPAAIVGALSGLSNTYAGDSWDYRLGADYRLNPSVLAYASFSTGYKGGGINPRPYIPSQVVPFGPERVNAYEIGVKSDLFDRRLRLNLAAFLNKYRDIILIDANGFPGAPGDPDFFPLSAVPFNAGRANIKGIELETVLHPVGGLNITGSFSYLDFKYTELDPNAAASGITSGFISPFTPKWKWSIDASYELALGNGATITPQFDIDHQSSVYTDPVNATTNYLAGRTIANASLRFQAADQKWELIGGVTNLTDKHYYTNAFDIALAIGTVQNSVGRPREFYVTLRRNF
ncbi:MAG TPA: TonB-dependent receptor [Sphingomonadaceae bacterium]|nr:TonB-dependent receptor [Sphingomonadaceae bacterium]